MKIFNRHIAIMVAGLLATAAAGAQDAVRCSPYVAKYDLMKDSDRFEVTHNPADKNLWRVPGLRNLVYTAPYMHNGSVKTLPEAVRMSR